MKIPFDDWVRGFETKRGGLSIERGDIENIGLKYPPKAGWLRRLRRVGYVHAKEQPRTFMGSTNPLDPQPRDEPEGPAFPTSRKLWFGKHNGRSFAEVAKSDPGYIAWMGERKNGFPYAVRNAANRARLEEAG